MTSELRARVLAALRADGTACFVRDARDDQALWVTDYPMHATATDAARERLLALNVCYWLDEQSRLWQLDLTAEGYARLCEGLPTQPPPMPCDDRLHYAYALCRLLLLHPAPLADQPLAPLRRVLKLYDGADERMLHAIPPLNELCAALLRQHQPLPTAAGRALALWLHQKEDKA